MVLTEGDLDETGDKLRDTTTQVLQQFEQQYTQTLVLACWGLTQVQR